MYQTYALGHDPTNPSMASRLRDRGRLPPGLGGRYPTCWELRINSATEKVLSGVLSKRWGPERCPRHGKGAGHQGAFLVSRADTSRLDC